MKKIIPLFILPLFFFQAHAEDNLEKEIIIEPSQTCLFATKDTCDLYLDIYYHSSGEKAKAAVIYSFGGGFKMGHKREDKALRWFRKLTDDGYDVIAIDYRLGLKGYKITGLNGEFINTAENAVNMAVEDLFSATSYLIENGDSLNIDSSRLIAAGSSAGAIMSLQAEWEICNSTERASVLPEDFNYAGIISYAGAIFNRKGGPVYAKESCPTIFFQGMSDKIVAYDKMQVFNLFFGGTKSIVKYFEKHNFNYNAYRYKGRGHEVAGTMDFSYPEVTRFMETNIINGERRIVDAVVEDPSIPIPDWARGSTKDLYDYQE